MMPISVTSVEADLRLPGGPHQDEQEPDIRGAGHVKIGRPRGRHDFSGDDRSGEQRKTSDDSGAGPVKAPANVNATLTRAGKKTDE